jgi:GNAT superfamily N-acetyltransferase
MTQSPVQLETVHDRKTLREFVRCAPPIYGHSSPWIRPLDAIIQDFLDEKKNPFFSAGSGRAFIARRGHVVAGRILVHVWERHRSLHDQPVAYFGFFECVDDDAVARALFEAARRYAREKGCSQLRGPINMTMAQEMGALVDGFSAPPSIDMVFTAPWYPRLLEANGFNTCLRASTWKNSSLSALQSDHPAPIHDPRLTDAKITFRTMNFFGRNAEMEQIRQVVNSAFLGNPGFVPITRPEWVFQLGPLLPLLDPAIVQIAESNGTMVGVSLVVPDFNEVLKRVNGRLLHPAIWRFIRPRSIRAATIILFAVRKQFQALGISRQLNLRLMDALRLHGYRSLSITWIADENSASLAQARALGMEPLHRIALYETSLN